MLNDFDILSTPSGGYELISGHSTFNVEFSQPEEKAMFDLIIQNRDSSSRVTVRAMIKAHGKPATFSFYDKLKAAGILFYNDDDALEGGRTFDKAQSLAFKLDEAAERQLGIVGASPLVDMLRSHTILAQAKVIDAANLARSSFLQDAVSAFDFFVVDASSYNPDVLGRINRAAVAAGKPWLLVQGVYERAGHVGPLFFGRDTGCYQCFRDRLRSNANARESFDRYETWLAEKGNFSQAATLPSDTFNRHIASMAAMEAEKFLLDYDIPQSYGYLLSIDPRTYQVEQHRLFKTPFCEVCNANFEYRRAPWMDSITLSAA